MLQISGVPTAPCPWKTGIQFTSTSLVLFYFFLAGSDSLVLLFLNLHLSILMGFGSMIEITACIDSIVF